MHVCLNARPVVGFKFVPFGENGHGKRPIHSFVGVFLKSPTQYADFLSRNGAIERLHDFIAGGDCSDLPGTALYKLQIRSHSLAPTVGFCGGVYRNKNHLRLRNRSVYILRKEQVSATSLGHYLRQSGFVNGQMIQILTNSRFRPLSKP